VGAEYFDPSGKPINPGSAPAYTTDKSGNALSPVRIA
jgi:hypothetical protein